MSDQDNIPTPRTLFEEIRSEIIRVERELATVTKERDHWKCECNIETLRAGKRATERDSLRAKVERLKVENDKLTNRNAALAVMAGISAPAQSESSQVGGKESAKERVQRMNDATTAESPYRARRLIAHLRSDLAVAQATIAELERRQNLAAEGLVKWEALCAIWDDTEASLRAQLATVRAQRDKFEIQLATAIAERDERVTKFATAILHGDEDHKAWLLAAANAFNAGTELPPANGLSRAEKAEKERDSALAVCAAKDVALRSAQSFIDLYSGPTHEVLKVIDTALSPTAGIDYVPKGVLQQVVDAAESQSEANGILFWTSHDGNDQVVGTSEDDDAPDYFVKAWREIDAALTIAAPFLADSTGEEGE